MFDMVVDVVQSYKAEASMYAKFQGPNEEVHHETKREIVYGMSDSF
jgi:hypothetical protein